MGNFAENLNLGNRFRPPPRIIIFYLFLSRGAGKARFNVATPTYATVTCTAYVLPYNFQTKSI